MNYRSKFFIALGLWVAIAAGSYPAQALTPPPAIKTPTRADLLFNRGIDKFLAGDYAGAIADYTLALQTNPRRSDLYIARGEARRRLGDLQGAITDSTRALQLNPQAIDAWTNRCAARYAKGDLPGAIADCSQSLTLDPTDADAFYNRALAYRQQGATQKALNDFQHAAELYQQQLDAQESSPLPTVEIDDGMTRPSFSIPSGNGGEPEPAPQPEPLSPPKQPILLRGGSPSGKFAQPRGRGIPGRREAAGSR